MKFPLKLKGSFGELVQAVLVVIGIMCVLCAFGSFLGRDLGLGLFFAVIGSLLLYVFYPRDSDKSGP